MAGATRLPPLSVLRAFEATVRHGSVTRAARELNLTDGAVSRAVRELEADLGFALFKRGNRMIVPTSAARAFAVEVQEALGQLSQAFGRVRRAAVQEQPLVLSCEPTFLIRWLIPRLASLQEAVGAGRELRLVAAGGAVPFAREGIDLAIRRADFPIGDDIIAAPFLKERIGPVCRPEFAAEMIRSERVEGILLHTATRPNAWNTWSKLKGVELRPTREIYFEHFYLTLQAAVAGAGLAIGPIALVADDLAAGSLRAPWGFAQDETAYVLMAPRPQAETEAFRNVLKWLSTEARRLEAF